MNANDRRLFVALWPTDELRRSMDEAMRSHRVSGHAIPASNFHLTLAFLGSVPEPKVNDVRAAMASVVVQPFELILKELQWWQPQALLCWVPGSSESLDDLVRRLQSALRLKGFELEVRSFKAHVTVVRDVRSEPEIKPIRELRWQVHRIELFESRPSPDGSVYTRT